MPNFPLAPQQASDYAGEFDQIFYAMLGLAVFFTALVFSLVIFFAIRYRRGSRYSRKRPADHNLLVEILWSAIPMIMALGIFVWAARPFARLFGPAPSNATEIFVIGKQWMWHIQHANGVRENNELHIEVNQPIKLTMISQDVIHSFFVPAFRVHRDVLPGRYTSAWFTPTRVGQYHLFCSQYCGTEHSRMTGTVYVMEPADYQAWLTSGGTHTTAVRTSPEQAGAELYNQYACVSCHGFAPARAPSLVGLYNRREKMSTGETITADEAYIRESILSPDAKVVDGYQAVMPSFKGQINEEQALQLVAFIKSMTSQSQANPSAAAPATGNASTTAPTSANSTGNQP